MLFWARGGEITTTQLGVIVAELWDVGGRNVEEEEEEDNKNAERCNALIKQDDPKLSSPK